MTYSQEEENNSFGYSFLPGFLFVAVLWLVSLLSYLTGADLAWLGVLPRNFFGIVGVFTGPLIHSGLIHLLSNSFPLVLLSGFVLFMHRRVAVQVIVLVYLLSGLLTWFIGRPAYHIGASGVVYGLAGFLLFNGLLRRNRGALAVSLAVLFLYSGLFYGLFPSETDERVSWEGHIAGLVAGLVAAILYGDGKKPAEEPDEDENKHVSSTLGSHYSHLPVRYTITPSEPKNHFYYRLNPASGEAAMPTIKSASSSKKRNILTKKHD